MRISDWSSDVCSSDLGLVYKPVEAVTLYAVYGNSKTPSQSSVNGACSLPNGDGLRSEEHTSELQSLMRISYAVFCLKKKTRSTLTTELTIPMRLRTMATH